MREYEIYIAYDEWYKTPRAYLSAFDEDKQPIEPVKIFEDISSEYID